jgi:hypothetical protein
MGLSVVKQPDGLFAVFDTVSDTFLTTDATEVEVARCLIGVELDSAWRRVNLQVAFAKEKGKSGSNSYLDCLRAERHQHYPEDHPRYSAEPWTESG